GSVTRAVGGVCWLVIMGTSILWMMPTAGTMMDGMYIITNRARVVQHLLVFVPAALAYRFALAMGWPAAPPRRAAITLVNSLLALAVVALSPVATAVAAGVVDGHWGDL